MKRKLMLAEIQWFRIAMLSSLTIASLSALIFWSLPDTNSSAVPDTSPPPVVASDSEQLEILQALFSQVRFLKQWPPILPPPPPPPIGSLPVKPLEQAKMESGPVLLVDLTAKSFDKNDRESGCGFECPMLKGYQHPVIPKQLIRDLIKGNRQAYKNPDPGMSNVQITSKVKLEQLFERDGWDDFYAKFPTYAGYVHTTRAVLSPDKKHALIYVSLSCYVMCGNGYLHYLVRKNDTWKIELSVYRSAA